MNRYDDGQTLKKMLYEFGLKMGTLSKKRKRFLIEGFQTRCLNSSII
ncbi:MAG: hypothetical protein H6Q44_1034 [Deltaproteobacteria bacterium]|nr:hypothetical protein [Deltaproteobacteria bacterium]